MKPKSYKEDLFFEINHLQHFTFCKRQWGMMYFEGDWAENYLTILGQIVHKKVHDNKIKETRKNLFIERGMPVVSKEYQIYGVLDAVEFVKNTRGVLIKGRRHDDKYFPEVIEYKKGKQKRDSSDELQLAAQVVCLEEMFSLEIPRAYIYYHSIHRRVEVPIDEEIRNLLKTTLAEMRGYAKTETLPEVKYGKHCNFCSLKEKCMPEISKGKRVKYYIQKNTGVIL